RWPAPALGRRRATIPVLADADPTLVGDVPGDDELPPEIRDAAIVRRVLEWTPARAVARPVRSGFRPPPQRSGATRSISNVLFVSHCDFAGNSAFHVLAIASELHRRGLSPTIAVPGALYTVEDVGRPPFPVLTYRQVRRGKLAFPNGRGPDLVHAFTPRERIRRLTADVVEMYGCPYVVHVEDHDDAILASSLGGVDVESLRALPAPVLDRIIEESQSHPLRGPRFLDHAVGATVVIERLLELLPSHLPSAVVLAGFEEAMVSARETRMEVRANLGLTGDDFAVVYTGNVHSANLEELRSLWLAVAALRRCGVRVVLVKTGWSATEVSGFPELGEGLRDLGWVPRGRIPGLLAAADALVQPGAPGLFNDYRFPAKLPEFLASGRPVVLPRTNVGLLLDDGREALLLERGDADEMVNALSRLAADPDLCRRLGEAGRAFALDELRWSKNVDRIEELYRRIEAEGRSPAPAWTIRSVDPPVRLVAIVDETPPPEEVQALRAHGIHGFCLTRWPEQAIPDAPFCVIAPPAGSSALARLVMSPTYLRSNGVPLVFGAAEVSVAGIPLVSFEAAVERPPAAESLAEYEQTMTLQLGLDLAELPRFRALPPPPQGGWDVYSAWLRKLTLQAILLAQVREPVLLLDLTSRPQAGDALASCLEPTLTGLVAGARQGYRSRGLELPDERGLFEDAKVVGSQSRAAQPIASSRQR
ncbi:MAG: glycosyltransferase, partial [Gaiellaceae bacterium]